MSDDKKQNPNQPATPASGAHGQENKSEGPDYGRTAGSRAAGTGTHVAMDAALESVEHQMVRVSAQVVERLAGTINSVLKTLPSQAAAAFEKAVESGKFGVGYLKYVPGIGIAAAGAGGAAEYYIATKMGEHHLDALVNAGVSTVVGVGTVVAGTAALPAAAISFTACEVVREGLHAVGVGVEPSLIHQQIEASLLAYPKRLEKELSINEAKAALKDQNSEQYQAMATQYKQDYAKLAEQYKDYAPLGFPSTAEQYVDRRFMEVSRGLQLVAGDAPSGILRIGKGAPAKDKHVEAPVLDDAAAPAVTTSQTVAPVADIVSTAPVAPPQTEATTLVAATTAEPPRNAMFAALLASNDFKLPTTSCKASDVGDANIGCAPVQQTSAVQAQAAVAAR
jgi:hypothetical protein